ncbi:MAG: hypothetical protein KIT20_08965 [Alphaproteobacteria bacterium]|nr:hypothetical protein [Alphaproteobacteria bacterium]
MTPRAARLAALLLLLAALSAGWLLLVRPVLERAAAEREMLETKQATIQRLRALIAAEADFAARLEERRSGEGTSALFLPGQSEAGAIAFLQERAKRLIEESGATLISMEAMPAPQPGELRRVGLRIELGAGIAALQRILHGLEGGEPTILVEGFSVRTRGREFRAGRDPLDVTLEIAGFLAGGGAS